MKGFCSKHTLKYCLSILGVIVFTCLQAFSQATTGSIQGALTDQTHLVLVNAIVKATEVSTGVTRETKTNDTGNYSFPRLPLGKYDLTFSATGFKVKELKGVEIRLGIETTVNEVLQVGSSSETITVTAEALTIETISSQGSLAFEEKKIEDLPALTGRMDSLAYLTPGVVTGIGGGNTNGANISVNGQRQRSNNFTIDGQDNNDVSVTGPSLFMSNIDVVKEFSIITNNFSAEYGRNQGAIVNIVTRSGNNNLHLTLYGYHQNSLFSSNSFDNNRDGLPKPRLNDNNDGFTIGGPLKKDKIFYFANFGVEFQKSISFNSSSASSLVITPSGINTLTGFFPNSIPLQVYKNYGPWTRSLGNPTVLAGTTATKTVTIAGVNGGSPIPFEVAQITRAVSTPFRSYDWGNKWDFNITPKDTLNVRVLFQDQNWGNQVGSASGYEIDVPSRTVNMGATYTRTISNSKFNEFRFNYGRTRVMFEGANTSPFSKLEDNLSSITMPSGYLGFGLSTSYPQGRKLNNLQFLDNYVQLKGRHTIKAGVELRYQKTTSLFLPNVNGSFRFTSMTNFINNISTFSGAGGAAPTTLYNETNFFSYFQDDFKIMPNLTLNIGVRYEFSGQPLNKLHDLTVARESDSSTALWDTSLPLNDRTVAAYKADKNNWAPRFGFAYTPRFAKWLFGEDKTVFRGGFSIAYDPAFYNIMLNIASSAPNVVAYTVSGAAMPAQPIGSVVAATPAFSPVRGQDPRKKNQTFNDPTFHSPYAENWSFGMQRQVARNNVLEVRYVGTRGVSLFQSRNGNPNVQSYIDNGFSSFLPAGTRAAANGRVIGEYSLIRIRGNTGASTYHGLQTSYNGRFRDLMLGMSYTFSHTIDNVSEIFGYTGSGSVAIAQNPWDINRGERGNSNIDVPHVWTVNFDWDIPWKKSQTNLIGKILGGWSMAGNYRITSGRPMTVICYYCGNSTTDQTFNANFAGWYDTARPYISNPKAPKTSVGAYTSSGDLVDWWPYYEDGTENTVSANSVHFIINDDNSNQKFGTPFGMGRNVERSGMFSRGDFAMYKKIRLAGDRATLQFRWEVTNVFNTSYLGTPDIYIDDPGTFMDPTKNSGITPRNMTFGLRLMF
jgi:hypothetical protein